MQKEAAPHKAAANRDNEDAKNPKLSVPNQVHKLNKHNVKSNSTAGCFSLSHRRVVYQTSPNVGAEIFMTTA